MHLSADVLPATFAAFDAVLRPQARVLMALPEMQPELLIDGHDPDGRQFANHDPGRVRQLFATLGFALRQCEELVQSTDTLWRVLLFER